MDGFKIETMELAEVSMSYTAVARELENDTLRLRQAVKSLSTQTIDKPLMELLRSSLKAAEEAARESRDMGNRCRKIAEVYDRTERHVNRIVNDLYSVTLTALTPAVVWNHSIWPERRLLGIVRVDTKYRAAEPVLLSGNNLQSEQWILKRALEDIKKGAK